MLGTVWGDTVWSDTVWRDVRFALRTLSRNRTFTAMVLVALTLGIGATSSIFTVVNAVLLSSVPYEEPDRLVLINSTLEREGLLEDVPVSYPDFADWKAQNDTANHFGAMAIYYSTAYNVGLPDGARRVQGELASAEYFPLLGISAAHGRVYSLEEDAEPGAHPLVVLGHDLWQNLFGGRSVVGESLVLDSGTYQVIGVMPPGFRGLSDQAELWVPMAMAPKVLRKRILVQRGFRWFSIVARLNDDGTVEQAQAAMDAIAAALEEEHPKRNKGFGAHVRPMKEVWVGDQRFALLTLLGAATFVLLIACTCVSGLLLARAVGRRREISLRNALGAGRGRLIVQLLTESVVLAMVGCVLGLLLAHWTTDLLVSASTLEFQSFADFSVDGAVVGVMLLVSFLCALGFGLAPALLTSRVDLAEDLKDGAKSSGGGGRHRLQSALVIAEVAVALVLLVGAGLMIRGFQKHRAADLGFRTQELLTLRLHLKGEQYHVWPTTPTWDLSRQILDRVGSLPGVKSIALVGPDIPTDAWNGAYFDVERRPEEVDEGNVLMLHHISPGYFSNLGVALLKGRDFSFDDADGAPPVVMASQGLAERFWPGEDPIGKRVRGPWPSSPWAEVVGLVADFDHAGLGRQERPSPDLYMPFFQLAPVHPATVNLLVRPDGLSAMGLVPAIRQEVASILPDVPLFDVATMEQRLADQTGQDRFLILLMSLFAGLALVLATIGIYSVISYSVSQRTREIGVRVAVGAGPSDVLRLVLGRGAFLALFGVAIGALLAVVLSRFLVEFLYGLSGAEPVALAAIAALLVAVALLASYVPARRAMRIEPSQALRIE